MGQAFIPIWTRWETGRVNLDEIIYIEKDLKKISIHTYGREVSFYGKMHQIEEYLDSRFLVCHRSYLFNMDKIVHMGNQTLELETGARIHLGRESFRKARRVFEQYIKGKL